jgi:methanethiol oxidase
MATWVPDPTFYPSPRMASKAPPERLAYVASFDPERQRPDAMTVVDVDPASLSYAQIVGQTSLAIGDEVHHFGWNACSSCLCPNAPHPHVERRYLIIPGIRSSRLHIADTKPDPKRPKLVRTIEAEELADRAGYSRPHTVHCGPEGIYVSALAKHGASAPVVYFSWTMRASTCAANGNWTAGPRSSLTTSGGTLVTTRW